MYQFFNYFNIFSAPIFCLICLGRGPLFTLAAFGLAFVLHPIFDFIINKYFRELFLKIYGGENSRASYQLPLLTAVPFQILLVGAAIVVGTETTSDAILSGMLCGLSGGILGIGTAHEMTHRKKRWERKYGMAMLYTINYAHFHLEHQLHHRTIGTKNDPDTARRKESLYSFFFRSIPQGWMDCWNWEAKKLKNRKKNILSRENKMLMTTLTQVGLNLAIGLVFGYKALLVFLVQGIITILLLKWINYVEHYGLIRRRINGKLEPVGFHHSWDSTSALTNFSLFNLGFHSLHHSNPTVEYHELPKRQDEWNELPAGYSAMMMMAAFRPGSWMKLIERKLYTLNKKVYA